MMRLVLCDGCQRHVRDDAARCPFCGGAITPSAIGTERVGRLGRAALMAFGVAAGGVAVAACEKDIVQPYGAPPRDTGTAIAMPYGAPPEREDASPIAPPTVDVPPPDGGAPKDAAPADASAPKPAAKDAGTPKVTASTPATATTKPHDPRLDYRNVDKPYGAPPVPDDTV